jgi:hypothetical protein
VWATDSCLSKPDFVSSFGIKRLQKVLFVWISISYAVEKKKFFVGVLVHINFKVK